MDVENETYQTDYFRLLRWIIFASQAEQLAAVDPEARPQAMAPV
jgi:hypothetical protein